MNHLRALIASVRQATEAVWGLDGGIGFKAAQAMRRPT